MPPGVLPGHTVTLAGKGTEHPNKLPGSVRIVAVQLAHPRFERRGECIGARRPLVRCRRAQNQLGMYDRKLLSVCSSQLNQAVYSSNHTSYILGVVFVR